MKSAYKNFNEAVTCLLKHGAKVNAKNNDVDTALDIANDNGYTEIIKLLKDAGAK